MKAVYLRWEDASRRAERAQQEVVRLTRAGQPVTPELLAELAVLEDEVLVRPHALDAALQARTTLH